MQAHENALKRLLAHRPCSSCHRRQTPETVLVLIRRKESSMVLVTCAACHHRSIFLISTKQISPSACTTTPPAPITATDVRAMHLFLDTFNGDFLSLFGAGPQNYQPAD